MTPRFYLFRDDKTDGPFTVAQLRSMWDSGQIHGETLACEEGSDVWVNTEFLDTLLFPPLASPRASVPTRSLQEARFENAKNTSFKEFAVVFAIVLCGFGIYLWIGKGSRHAGTALNQSRQESTTPYINETGYITPGVWFGCETKEMLNKVNQMMGTKDVEALAKLMSAGITLGTATLFKAGEEVVVSDYSAMSSLLRVRRRGDPQEFWTFMPAVSKVKPK